MLPNAPASQHLAFACAALDAFYFEAPLGKPRRNAFGTMDRRPALFVRLTDDRGVEGWGEVFCNWPVFGGRHRARIIRNLLSPLVVGSSFGSPAELAKVLTMATRAITIQCDEPGPFDQSIAGVEIAAWDCVARRHAMPLASLLAGRPATQPCSLYASGLTADMVDTHVPLLLERGWTGFKLKVGFGLAADIAAIDHFRRVAGPEPVLMIDANQRFKAAEASELADALRGFNVAWFEEPISAVEPASEWQQVASRSAIPLAAGENVRGHAAFDALIDGGSIRFIQPDLIKWGGVSAMLVIAERVRLRGLSFCPHYLGGGIGLRTTAHVVAACASGWLEFDVTENPFREAFVDTGATIGGVFRLDDQPGHGAAPDLERLARFLIACD